MIRYFNAVCTVCRKLKPRCLTCYYRVVGTANRYCPDPVTLCEACRKLRDGHFRTDDKHK